MGLCICRRKGGAGHSRLTAPGRKRRPVAAVVHHYGVEAFGNVSQVTVSQMSISETTDSPQHKLHWLRGGLELPCD